MTKTNKTCQPVALESDLLKIAEVAQLDRCSTKTVQRAIAGGLLIAVRVGPGGRLVRIRRKDHEAYRRARSF